MYFPLTEYKYFHFNSNFKAGYAFSNNDAYFDCLVNLLLR